VADPTRDDFADAPDLVRHHLAAGRPVFALLPAAGWARWRDAAGPGPAARPVWSRGPVVLARIGPSGGEDLLPSGGEPPP
jgi:hypothetical protein